MDYLVRYNGTWIRVTPRPYEPERVTHQIAWLKIIHGKGYREWFENERKLSKILYNE